MNDKTGLDRRRFIKLCASAVAAATCGGAWAQSGPVQRYRRAQLVDEAGRPLTPARLAVGENYIFHYPYVCTPCFLLNLGKPAAQHELRAADGKPYRWEGGVGPGHSIVAFSAICAHKMSYPARTASFINYRSQPVNIYSKEKGMMKRAGVIYCCSENSVYDPAQGAEVLSGPAPQPLAAIVLEYDAKDNSLYAVGTRGGEMFPRFFDQFGFRLRLDYGTDNIKQEVAGSVPVVPLGQYTRQQTMC